MLKLKINCLDQCLAIILFVTEIFQFIHNDAQNWVSGPMDFTNDPLILVSCFPSIHRAVGTTLMCSAGEGPRGLLVFHDSCPPWNQNTKWDDYFTIPKLGCSDKHRCKGIVYSIYVPAEDESVSSYRVITFRQSINIQIIYKVFWSNENLCLQKPLL